MAYRPPAVYQQGAYPYPQQPAPQQQPGQGWGAPPQQPAPGWGAPPQQQAPGWGGPPPPGPYGAPPPQQPYPQQQPQAPYPQQQPQQPPYPQQQPQQPHYHAAQQPQPQPQYAPAGRKKALLVACCYPGTRAALNGCANDVQCIEYCLQHRFGFTAPGAIVVLRDDGQPHPDFVSTRRNILRGIQWLMQDQRPGDSLFFHFSGHGSQQTDWSGDELDGQDETILPTDHDSAGQIVDDELNELLVRPLLPGVTLHALIDACHSGTALDLPYRVKASGGRFDWKLKSRVIKGTSGGTAFQLGACKDSQTAADTNAMSGSAYTGAATFSFIDAIERHGTNQSYANLLTHMMESLRKQGGTGAGASPLGGLPMSLGGTLGGLSGGLTGMLAGAAAGMVASYVLGPGAMGGQVPVLACDKQIDVAATRLAI